MFSDRHYPSTFLSGNKSLRDMFKDPGEYDRRMAALSKQTEDKQKSVESRNARIKELTDRKSRIFGQEQPVISRSRAEIFGQEHTVVLKCHKGRRNDPTKIYLKTQSILLLIT